MKSSDAMKGAVVCQHVALQRMSILRAARHEPMDEGDSGWQFHCATFDHDSVAEAQLWALKNVVKDDLVLADLVEEPPGTVLTRRSRYAPWQVTHSTEETK